MLLTFVIRLTLLMSLEIKNVTLFFKCDYYRVLHNKSDI